MSEEPKLRVMRAIELIQSRPDMFFEGGDVSVEDLAARVLRDLAGVGDVESCVNFSDDIVFIAANVDWMSTARAAFQDLWRVFVVPTPARTNSHRAEVLLAATCSGLRSEGLVGSISLGEPVPAPSLAMRQLAGSKGRWLVFKYTAR